MTYLGQMNAENLWNQGNLFLLFEEDNSLKMILNAINAAPEVMMGEIAEFPNQDLEIDQGQDLLIQEENIDQNQEVVHGIFFYFI